jgi:uncharacterized OsmC-like protein
MPNIVDNVDLDKVSKTVEAGKKDKATLRKPIRLQGEWILDPSKGYQFRTEVAFEKGKQVIEMDSPSFMGGGGNRPGPMAYCVAGMASCFVTAYANVAATQGIKLTKLAVNAECLINFAKTMDVADEPITEGIKFVLDVQSENADRKKLEELLKMAEERCPAVYTMTHKVKVQTELK